jgi:hypothetical protein
VTSKVNDIAGRVAPTSSCIIKRHRKPYPTAAASPHAPLPQALSSSWLPPRCCSTAGASTTAASCWRMQPRRGWGRCCPPPMAAGAGRCSTAAATQTSTGGGGGGGVRVCGRAGGVGGGVGGGGGTAGGLGWERTQRVGAGWFLCCRVSGRSPGVPDRCCWMSGIGPVAAAGTGYACCGYMFCASALLPACVMPRGGTLYKFVTACVAQQILWQGIW